VEREINCANTKVIIEFIKAHKKEVCPSILTGLHPEIDEMADPEGFLTDRDNWISCDIVTKLFKNVKKLFHNPRIAYEIARFGAESISLGYVQTIIVKAFWSTKRGLKSVQKINDKLNLSKKVELVSITRNSAVVQLHWHPGMQTSKDLCLYNRGVYTFMPLIWGGRPLNLRESCCYFDGAPFSSQQEL